MTSVIPKYVVNDSVETGITPIGPNSEDQNYGTFAPRYTIKIANTGQSIGFLQSFDLDISLSLDVIDSISEENICYQYGSRRYSWSGELIAGKINNNKQTQVSTTEEIMLLALTYGMFDISLESQEPENSRYAFGTTVLKGCTIERASLSGFSASNNAPTFNISGLALEFAYSNGDNQNAVDHLYGISGAEIQEISANES